MIGNINEVWVTMNKLYWFKDQFNVEIQKEYLATLANLANQLEMSGLEKEINSYLKILK